MSLNRADKLRRELEEKHGFTAEQANGTMKIVDEMVDNGFDRVLKSIADLDSKIDTTAASLRSDMTKDIASLRTEMSKDIASLRTEMNKDIESLRSDMDVRFNVVANHLKTIEDWIPVKIGFITIALIAAYAAIFGS